MVIVLHNQSLLDFAIQHTGNVANVYLIAVANGFPVSQELDPGMSLIIPDEVVIDKDILSYYSSRAIQPATALSNSVKQTVRQRGIGFMQIGRTFKVAK